MAAVVPGPDRVSLTAPDDDSNCLSRRSAKRGHEYFYATQEKPTMNDFSIPGSQSTPAISGNWTEGVLSMQGDSYPENSFELFGPVLDWIQSYLDSSSNPLRLELRLLYLNTSSVKAIMDLFDLLEEAHLNGRAVSVNWYYDRRNERVAQLAEEFKEDFTFAFEIVGQDYE
jgi:hypothetical protein